MTNSVDERSLWGVRADRLLNQAQSELADSLDAIPTVEAALAALRIEVGELPETALDDFPSSGEELEDDEALCICPLELRERGGFKGGCPVHAARAH